MHQIDLNYFLIMPALIVLGATVTLIRIHRKPHLPTNRENEIPEPEKIYGINLKTENTFSDLLEAHTKLKWQILQSILLNEANYHTLMNYVGDNPQIINNSSWVYTAIYGVHLVLVNSKEPVNIDTSDYNAVVVNWNRLMELKRNNPYDFRKYDSLINKNYVAYIRHAQEYIRFLDLLHKKDTEFEEAFLLNLQTLNKFKNKQ